MNAPERIPSVMIIWCISIAREGQHYMAENSVLTYIGKEIFIFKTLIAGLWKLLSSPWETGNGFYALPAKYSTCSWDFRIAG